MSHSTAKIVLDSVSPAGVRITTFEILMPRIILAEWNTHAVLAKSAASSRAIPVDKRIADLEHTFFMPDSFVKNQKGMSGTEYIDDFGSVEARKIWMQYRDDCIKAAKGLKDLQVHKQYANRVLETVSYVKQLTTATEWRNFFNLRVSVSAQPEIDEIAKIMKKAMRESRPVERNMHYPFVSDTDMFEHHDASMISAARCARISYRSNSTGKVSTPEEDIPMARELKANGHMSPFEHVAVPDIVLPNGYWADPVRQGKFFGWIPVRAYHEANKPPRRNSFAPVDREALKTTPEH